MTNTVDNIFPPTGYVRVGSISSIPRVLIDLGYDPESVFEELDFASSELQDPDQMISYERRGELFYQCVSKTKCMSFGLLVGQYGDLSSLGLIGLLCRQSPNVRVALRNLVRYFHLHASEAITYLDEQGDEAFFGYGLLSGNATARQQTESGANAIINNILYQLCGFEWHPIQVLFSHRKPSDIGPYKSFFKGPIVFDSERNGVLFSRRWLDKELTGATPSLLIFLQTEVQRISNLYKLDFAGQVRHVLASALFSHQSTIEDISKLFSMHPRTFRRRLIECNTSFKEITDEVRFEIAKQLLKDSSMKLIDIADVLDYSAPGSFTRAFKCWSEVTPSRWRREKASNIGS